jgi:hypothetical protein
MGTPDEEVVGQRGTVSVRIRGGDRPGEVLVAVRGGTESFIAFAEEEIARNEVILVYRSRGERAVDVTPFPESGALPDPL